MSQAYIHKKTCIFLLNYHFVWTPKRRRPVLVGNVGKACENDIKATCEELSWDIQALEVMPDHVHLFLSAEPSWSPDQIIKRIKGRSSKNLRDHYPQLLRQPSLWTRAYFVSTAGNVSSATIRRYIDNQWGNSD